MNARLVLVSVTCNRCHTYGRPGRQRSLDDAELVLVCDLGWMYAPDTGWLCATCKNGDIA